MITNTPRLRLRCWDESHRDAFAAMHADPEVMHDYGGPISRGESDAKFDRYPVIYREHGFSRWAIETETGFDRLRKTRKHGARESDLETDNQRVVSDFAPRLLVGRRRDSANRVEQRE